MHFKLLCQELEKKGIECDEIPLKKTRNFLTLPTFYYLKKIKSDLIVTHNPFHGLYGASIAKKMNKTKRIAFRLKADHWSESSSSKLQFRNKLGFKIKMLQYNNSKKNVDFVLAISDWMKKVAIKNGIEKPIYTMYNGVDTQRFFPKKINEKYKTEILSVLNFNVPEKIELLKEFLNYYKKSGQDYKITFVGDGIFLPMIKQYSKSKNLDNAIVFKGWVNDIENYYLVGGLDE